MNVLYAGVRYRLATGVRAAMRLWGALLVALAVAAGLEVQLPLLRWAADWAAEPFGWRLLTAATLVAAVSLFVVPRMPADPHLMVLPLSARQRYAVDAVSAGVFVSPLVVVLVSCVWFAGGFGRAVEALVYSAAFGLRPRAPELSVTPRKAGQSGFTVAIQNDLRWLLRSGSFAAPIVIALLTTAGAELAIRNNDVTRLHSMARIAGLFAAIGAATLATEVAKARRLARPYRALERSFPVSAERRVRELLLATLVLSAPFLLVMRPLVMAYAFVTLIALTLLGERYEKLVFGAGAAAALLCALDARVALVGMLALLPLAWRVAVEEAA